MTLSSQIPHFFHTIFYSNTNVKTPHHAMLEKLKTVFQNLISLNNFFYDLILYMFKLIVVNVGMYSYVFFSPKYTINNLISRIVI